MIDDEIQDYLFQKNVKSWLGSVGYCCSQYVQQLLHLNITCQPLVSSIRLLSVFVSA